MKKFKKITLENVQVSESSEKLGFQIKTPKKSFVVFAEDSRIKQSWISAFSGIASHSNLFIYSLLTPATSPGESKTTELAPVWLPDRQSSHCMICNTSFTVIKRRHHCRKCGMYVLHKLESVTP